jgi:hypothetical protein
MQRGGAIERGELREGVDMKLLLDVILGPLYSRLAVTRREVSEEYLERLASGILAGVRADAYSNTDAPPRARGLPQALGLIDVPSGASVANPLQTLALSGGRHRGSRGSARAPRFPYP